MSPLTASFPPQSLAGVRNYLKEALVNIIAVHAEVSCRYVFLGDAGDRKGQEAADSVGLPGVSLPFRMCLGCKQNCFHTPAYTQVFNYANLFLEIVCFFS